MGRFTSLELEEAQIPEPIKEEKQDMFGTETQNADSFLSQAIAEFQLCNYEKSMQLFSRVLSFDNSNLSAWVGQIRCLINVSEFKEAVMWVDKAIEVMGETANILSAKACALCRMGDFSRAYGLSDVSLEQPGASSYVWLVRGEILLQQKRNNFDFCFDKVLSFQSDPWEMQVEIARVYMFYQKNAAALNHLEQAKEAAASKGLVWYELGNCYINMGMKSKAVEAFNHAIQLEPRMEMAQYKLKEAETMGFWSNVKRKIFS